MLQISHFLKSSDEDTYKDGCLLDSSQVTSFEMNFEAENQEDLITSVMDFIGIDSREDVLIDPCEDDASRIDFQVYEDSEGIPASKNDFDLWKQGKMRLWLCNYSTRVNSVSPFVLSK